MSIKTLLYGGLPLLLAGCVYSHHRPEVVYTPVPVYSTTVLPPTSDRPGVRVYQEPAPGEPVPPPPPGSTAASPRDLAIADSVRSIIHDKPVIPSVADNVMVTVVDGAVTLTGTVPSDTERDEIVARVRNLPGVTAVKDHLAVALR